MEVVDMRMKEEKKATMAVPEDVDSNEEAENENANGDVCEEFLTALDEQINELQVSWHSRFDTKRERSDSLPQMSSVFVSVTLCSIGQLFSSHICIT